MVNRHVASPVLHSDVPGALGVLVWEWPEEQEFLSSAPVRGGRGTTARLLNIQVPLRYARVDLDTHAEEVSRSLGVGEAGTALFTAAALRKWQRSEISGVMVDTTVGITKPTWAADDHGGFAPYQPGTINLVVQLPRSPSEAAAVNAVMTATEAKSQALLDAGVPGTGTASDAMVLLWPSASADDDQDPFAGPRSPLGSAVARAVYQAVAAGVDAAAS